MFSAEFVQQAGFGGRRLREISAVWEMAAAHLARMIGKDIILLVERCAPQRRHGCRRNPAEWPLREDGPYPGICAGRCFRLPTNLDKNATDLG
jgi:hypothetical protein